MSCTEITEFEAIVIEEKLYILPLINEFSSILIAF